MRVTVDDLEDETLLLVLDDGWFECGYDCLLVSSATDISGGGTYLVENILESSLC
jgi:hypothetical protein